MATLGRVVVVGASVAGLRTAERLRGHGHAGPLTLVGAEPHLPYERPPLSKQLLAGVVEPSELRLRDETDLRALDLDLRLGVRATRLDPTTRTVELEDGGTLRYGTLVVATGVTPRSLPTAVCPPRIDGVLTLRTVDDSLALRSRLASGNRLVVVGGGLIGCEVAATARTLGVDVTIVEADVAPMSRALGPDLGAVVAELHRAHGVALRLGRSVTAVEATADDRVSGVRLTDGELLRADTVLVAVGARPATEWLEGSGLDLTDGVDCDANGRTALPDVFAVGDVARWQRPLYDGPVRVEHWTNATEHAAAAAAAIVGAEPPAPAAPYAWSDQYDVRLQVVGLPALGRPVVVHRSATSRQVVAVFAAEDRLVGAFGMNAPRHMLQARRMVADGAAADAASKWLPVLA